MMMVEKLNPTHDDFKRHDVNHQVLSRVTTTSLSFCLHVSHSTLSCFRISSAHEKLTFNWFQDRNLIVYDVILMFVWETRRESFNWRRKKWTRKRSEKKRLCRQRRYLRKRKTLRNKITPGSKHILRYNTRYIVSHAFDIISLSWIFLYVKHLLDPKGEEDHNDDGRRRRQVRSFLLSLMMDKEINQIDLGVKLFSWSRRRTKYRNETDKTI